MEQFSFSYAKTSVGKLPERIAALIDAARHATALAYAPYSGFKVGAAVLMEDGSMISGANKENAAFSAGICAERAALSNISFGDHGNRVLAIAIAYKGEIGVTMPLSPCGVCRQFILEVQKQQGMPIAVYMTSPNDEVIVVDDAAHLLPLYFSNSFLKQEA